MSVMLSLGGFQFSLSTAVYQELSRSAAFRWASSERIGQHAAKQFTGPGEDTISLPGIIYPEFRGGRKQINNLRALAGQGKPLLLVSGAGEMLGRWVIDKIDEKQNIFTDSGVARRQEFTVSIQYFDEGEIASMLKSIASDSEEDDDDDDADDDDSTLGKIKSWASNAKNTASTAISSLNSALSELKQVADTTSAAVSNVMGAVNNGIRMANTVRESAKLLQGNLKNIKNIKNLKDLQAVGK